MSKLKFYSEQLEEGTVSIGYGTYPVKGHVLEMPEEVAQGWDHGPMWEPYQPKKHSKGVKADDSESE